MLRISAVDAVMQFFILLTLVSNRIPVNYRWNPVSLTAVMNRGLRGFRPSDFTFTSELETRIWSEETSEGLLGTSEDVWRTSPDIFSDVSWQLGLGWMCLYEDKGGAVRDQAALSGPQLGLMAAEHRLRLALIWMSTRRLVLFLPASLCALPRFAVCQRIALAASSSHAKVINKHLQMAPNNSLQSDTAQSVQASSAEPVQEPFRSSPGRPAEPKRFCSSRSLWAQNISANGRRAQWMKMRMQAAGVDSPETCSAPSVGVERR